MTTSPSEVSSRSPYSPAVRSTMAYRYNFYSRLMTSDRDLDLKAPAHVIDPALYFAFSKSGQSSRATVFSIWNTMIGSTILSIPWGLQQSGLLLGSSNVYLVIIVLVGLLSCYTCWLTVKHSFARNLEDIIELVEKMWGKPGKIITLIFSCAVLVGAGMAYNILMNSAFFRILDGLCIWMSGDKIGTLADWGSFSDKYTSLILYGLLVYLSTFKNKSTYIKLNSLGLIFVIIISLSIIGIGFRALALNNFTTSGSSDV